MALQFLFGGMRSLKKNFIQKANRRSRLKGTLGSFGRWCRSEKLDQNGKVTMKCIQRGLRSDNVKIRKRANFARNIKAYVGAKKRVRFGKKKKVSLKDLVNKIKKNKKKTLLLNENVPGFGKRNKTNKRYTSRGGRRSPGVSATRFPVGTVKTGLDKKKWKIVATRKGVKRWTRVKRSAKRSTRFGETPVYPTRPISLKEFEKDKEVITKLIAKEMNIAENIIDNYPKNNTLLRRSINLFNKTKDTFLRTLTFNNMYAFLRSTVHTLELLVRLLLALTNLSSGYSSLMGQSRLFASLLTPLDILLDKYRPQENRTGPEENRYHYYNVKKNTEQNHQSEPIQPFPGVNLNFPNGLYGRTPSMPS
jgi:hypothetical protein